MDSVSIQIFVRAAETRSFVAAGRQLGVSASGVGKNIARLEQRLGVRLFHRSTRTVTLTNEGEIFLDRARRILQEFQAAETELSNSISSPRGRLRISLPLIGEPFLALLADFQIAYPDIELDLDFDNRKVDVIEEGFDAVIRSGNLEDSQMTARSLGSFGAVIVGTPEYFRRYGMPGTPSDLSAHRCVHLRNRHTGKLLSWNLAKAPDDPEPHLPPSVVCNTIASQLAFVLRGAGISYFPDFAVEDDIARGTLVTTLDALTTRKSSFHLLWPSGGHMPLKLRVFIDYVSGKSPLKTGRNPP